MKLDKMVLTDLVGSVLRRKLDKIHNLGSILMIEGTDTVVELGDIVMHCGSSTWEA